MPRAVFRLASDGETRDVDCFAFGRVDGRPYCDAQRYPYCLAPGGSPENCPFHRSRAEYYAELQTRKAKNQN